MKFEHLYFHGLSTATSRAERMRGSGAGGGRRTSAGWKGNAAESDFFDLLLGRSELPVAAYRRQALVRRLPACLRLLRVGDVTEAARMVATQPEVASRLLNLVLLGVTDFFRDRAVFADLEAAVLPELLSRHGKLRVWSAACSNGQELYSVAMLLARAGRLADCELLGTDCRPEAIEEARRGAFRAEDVTQLEAAWRETFFESDSGRIAARLREQASWKVANLFRGVERGPWHLVLWRNMAIYLESQRADEIWARLCEQVVPGGFLVAGKADHPPKWLRLTRVGPCLYQKGGR